jgi:hypothetical protein
MSECICEVEPVRYAWQHDRDCLKWGPPLTGPGGTEQARRQAIEAAAQAVRDAKVKGGRL